MQGSLLRLGFERVGGKRIGSEDRKSTRLNSSHLVISYAAFCLKKKKTALISRERRWPRCSIRGALLASLSFSSSSDLTRRAPSAALRQPASARNRAAPARSPKP